MNLTLSRLFDRAGYLFVLALMIGPYFFLPRAQEDPFRVPAELLLTGTAWLFALTVAASQALSDRPVLGGGDRLLRRLTVGLFVWMVVSAAFGLKPVAHLSYLSTVAAFLVGAQAFIGWLEQSLARRAPYVMAVLATLITLEGLLAISQALKLPFLRQAGEADYGPLVGWIHVVTAGVNTGKLPGDAIGTLGNRNYLSELFALAAPALLGWAVTFKTVWRRLPIFALVLTAVGVIVYNGTRAALLGLMVGALISVLLVYAPSLRALNWRAALKRRWPAVALGLIVLVGLGVLAGGRLQEKLSRTEDSSADSRLVNYKAAAGIFWDHPLTGTGVGGFSLANTAKLGQMYPEGLPESAAPLRFYQLHNDPLQALSELGLPGFLLMGALAVVWLRRARLNPALPAPWRVGLVGGMVAVWVTSLFGFPFHVPQTAMVILLLMGVAIARPAEPEAVPLTAAYRWPLAIAAVMVLAGVGWLGTTRGALPVYEAGRHNFMASRAKDDTKTPAAEILYGLAAREDRFKSIHVFRQMQALMKKRKFAEVVAVYDAHATNDGLGMDALLVKANALRNLDRLDEARVAYIRVKNHYAPDTKNYKIAARRLAALDAKPASPPIPPKP